MMRLRRLLQMFQCIDVDYAPPEAFPHIHGAHNYQTVTPEPTIFKPQILKAEPNYSTYRQPRSVSAELPYSPSLSDKLDVIVFLGSVRAERNATRVGSFIAGLLQGRGHRVTVVDPRDYNLAVLEQPLHFYKYELAVPDYLVSLNDQIKNVDAFVVVSAEYNSAISPALCSLLDHFPPASYAYRPSAIVVYSTGQFGGIRAAMQLRQHLSELETVHIPKMTVIPKVETVLNGNGGVVAPAENYILNAAEAMVDQLEWYALALRERRKRSGTSTFV
ncbi:NAD(P)H-dependent FMN reductase PA1204-like isoform X2 [Paramacrobiotus metropolitanus]|uniref:NAD(P)H-dependent FMN reductase PA1204-like isoform X2 n=1 Tax=Paramacrobiotus metropolitanus TaxID=2943436 RepID=UPI00244583FE|nr:NAD(P)H-dependent FMN reductase PA1204-like isoform X2 [Paramacrobiotus metropolitanus]